MKDPVRACKCICKIAAGDNQRKLDQCEKACGGVVDCINKLIDGGSAKDYCNCVCDLLPSNTPKKVADACYDCCKGLK